MPHVGIGDAAHSLIGLKWPVLDHGFVRVVDVMGDDAAIVQAARVSYGAGTKKVSEDAALIQYLMRHRHTTPFEMCEIKLHVKVPMDCWRQWIRHRTASVNEYSTRYSEAINDTQETSPLEWRLQSGANKQGSSGVVTEWPQGVLDPAIAVEGAITPGEWLSRRERGLHEHARAVYEERLKYNVAREQARKDLPLSTYTEAYWKIDLHNLLHFLGLRMDSHAQQEIRAYADIIGNEILSRWVPLTWTAFLEHRLNAVTFSKTELRYLGVAMRDGLLAMTACMNDDMFLGRSRVEFNQKLERIGIIVVGNKYVPAAMSQGGRVRDEGKPV